MNRIILIGNGFDLAHGFKTSYEDFIDWYWEYRVHGFQGNLGYISEDPLCKIEIVDRIECWNVFDFYLPRHFNKMPGKDIIQSIIDTPSRFKVEFCPFFEKIITDVEKKGWVDIEDIYYAFLKSSEDPKQINDDLEFIKEKLVEYLITLEESSPNPIIQKQILEPISKEDIAIGAMDKWNEMLKKRIDYKENEWRNLMDGYMRWEDSNFVQSYEVFNILHGGPIRFGNIDSIDATSFPIIRLPDNIMMLNFNYTNTADLYLPKADKFSVNHIHGSLTKPESIIFGYGDERDDEYDTLMKKNDNEYLRHIKSFRYLDASNYRKMLAFIESEPYQLCIMGHSCGLSDRTLLSTLFEHPNCVSIKPYYYRKEDGTDNYRELVQNIARNFSDPRLMRDRVVGKERCEALGVK